MISKMFGKEDEFAWRDVFFKDDFSVDRFLSKNTNKSDLVSLRQGLKKYGTDLHKCMSEILKNETEAIVNLAEALGNLTSKIDDLSKPASQLQEEVRALYEAIRTAKASFDDHLKKAKAINDKREFLNVNKNLINTCISIENILDKNLRNGEIDLLLLERVINDYSFQKTYSQRKGFNLVQNDSVAVIERKLNKVLDAAFVNAVKMNQSKTIERCLRMYVNMGRQSEAESIFKDKFLHAPLSDVFSQKNFERNSQQLEKLYEQSLQVLESSLNLINEILAKNIDLRGFNFVVNAFWKEVDKLIRDNLPNVTAPGNPELFQKRFKDTWRFLQEIARHCGDLDLVCKKDTFQEHVKRFNLPVYFEIRFQQIAGKLEKELLLNCTLDGEFKNRGSSEFQNHNKGAGDVALQNKTKFKLRNTVVFWACFRECYQDDVFIDHLASNFVKLAMLLLSRYLRWLESILDKAPKNDTSGKLEEFIVLGLFDLDELRSRLGDDSLSLDAIKDTVYKIIRLDMHEIVLEVSKSNGSAITGTFEQFQKELIQLKLQESMDKLQEVAAVPRLYRRTNRNVPTEPSSYILSAVDIVIRFHNAYGGILRGTFSAIADNLVTKITEKYLTLVQEVLHSVGKTEKSLRRLKNRNLNLSDEASGSIQSDLNSDEGKIREQIRLDVDYFTKKLQPLTLERGALAIIKLTEELKSTV